MSTVLTKQHYFIDIVGGLGIALVCYFIVEELDPGAKIINARAKRLNRSE